MTEVKEITLLKDSHWSHIDGQICLVNDFSPMLGSKVENGVAVAPNKTVPYASIEMECSLTKAKITGFVTHSMDFINLWSAFIERGVSEDEEVIILWSMTHYKHMASKLMSKISPKMWVLVCPKGSYKEWAVTWQTLGKEKDMWRGAAGLLNAHAEWKPEVIA